MGVPLKAAELTAFDVIVLNAMVLYRNGFQVTKKAAGIGINLPGAT